jgi:hypothetical protein
VRDFMLNEALKRLAAEAATRFTTLVASGDQIPFDVAEQAGPDSLFHSYVPLTGRYVREREDELRSLPAFEAARQAVESTEIAADYLEQRGEPVVSDPGERASRMLLVFIASLWDGCTDFALDRARLDSALALVDAQTRGAADADVLIAPIVGLKMSAGRLRLPHGAQIVRAEEIEAPLDAMRSEGMGRAAWEPQFLAVAEQAESAESVEAAIRQLRELISVMRLFKAGGVALGPYAFAPTGEGSWRRIATGAGAPRPGGYRLSESEAEQLRELAEALEARPDPVGTLAWAVSRFELGCERRNPVEGLSDHLLAMRGLLEGQGPVGASLPMRAAALIGDGPENRIKARESVEGALKVERALMAGSRTPDTIELSAWLEDRVRRLLRSAALGELAADLGTAADEALIASGLAEGDADISVSVMVDTGIPGSDASASDRVSSSGSSRGSEGEASIPEDVPPPYSEPSRSADDDCKLTLSEEDYMEEDTRILEPVPGEGEIHITATNWLEEVEVEEDAGTIEWPAGAARNARRERIDTPRVRHLFPVPEDADWEVRELDYDHYRRHAG